MNISGTQYDLLLAWYNRTSEEEIMMPLIDSVRWATPLENENNVASSSKGNRQKPSLHSSKNEDEIEAANIAICGRRTRSNITFEEIAGSSQSTSLDFPVCDAYKEEIHVQNENETRSSIPSSLPILAPTAVYKIPKIFYGDFNEEWAASANITMDDGQVSEVLPSSNAADISTRDNESCTTYIPSYSFATDFQYSSTTNHFNDYTGTGYENQSICGQNPTTYPPFAENDVVYGLDDQLEGEFIDPFGFAVPPITTHFDPLSSSLTGQCDDLWSDYGDAINNSTDFSCIDKSFEY
ncbi:uncharacterized protein C8R40DRAFT_1169837 [Lentinula edodes]|uniref:uncharacterized protein n=1 Tax=Lentinula edodes TaxID=5353 RepID=UPI001E8E465D|nr:uncharacterized protein C8R40DRAFT_1169837 [Lentinula edodes]KAH7876175.1 hypothetical protein C8R40DRAFT_1169837 [Lentinula edodes]KAJ3913611.1 hypothetical protein F5877DRAFT_83636 [Lentinula edodes]